MASCCGSLWYCTPDGPVEVTAAADGTYSPPVGWNGQRPYKTEAEALGECTGLAAAPTCSDVDPSTLPSTLIITITVDDGSCACSAGTCYGGGTLTESPPNAWSGDCADCGLDDFIGLTCIDGMYTLSGGATWGALCPGGVAAYAVTPVTGTASPFSVVFRIEACRMCGTGSGMATVVITE